MHSRAVIITVYASNAARSLGSGSAPSSSSGVMRAASSSPNGEPKKLDNLRDNLRSRSALGVVVGEGVSPPSLASSAPSVS